MKWNKAVRVMIAAAAAALLSAAPVMAYPAFLGAGAAEGWNQVSGDWYYVENGQTAIGWKQVDGVWYRFGDDGVMLKEKWFKDADGSVYYLSESGAMLTGWFAGNRGWYYFDGDGRMARNSWRGSYYFNDLGIMLDGSTTPDGFYVNGDGVWVPALDYSINGVYVCEDLVKVYDSPAGDQYVPDIADQPQYRIGRRSSTELDVSVIYKEYGSDVWTESDTRVFRLMYAERGEEPPFFDNTQYEADGSLSFSPEGELILHPYYGGMDDRYEFIFRKTR